MRVSGSQGYSHGVGRIMEGTSRLRFSSSGREQTRNSWPKKAYAELLAITRIVRLYPKSTLLAPLLLLAVILAVGIWGVTHVAQFEERSARDRASILALDAAVWVQQVLANSIAPVLLTSAMVSYNPYYPAVKSLFQGLAPVMHAQAPPGSLRVLQLVPQGVVTDSYPTQGNEGAIDLDLFASPTNRDGAIKTASDRTLTLVGPMNFVQGGTGFIVRKPIFVPNVTANETFAAPHPAINPACGRPCAYNTTSRTALWGFASALVDLDVLTQSNGSKLRSLEDLGYRYELMTRGSVGTQMGQLVAGSADKPRDPVEVAVRLPNSEWALLLAPKHGWSSRWYGGLLAGVVVLAVATAVLLFASLVMWRRHQMLLEALLPKRILRDLRHDGSGSSPYSCPEIRTADTPADLLLNMMGDLLEGYPPKLSDVVFIRTALLRNLDLYTPLDVRSQIKAADLDSEVAQALMQQLMGGGGRRTSFTTSRQLTSQFGGDGGAADDAHKPGGIASTTLSYDVETLPGALAFLLSPEAAWREVPAVAEKYGGGGGGGGAMSPQCGGGGSGANMHSCPLLAPRGGGGAAATAGLLSCTPCTTHSLADVATAPPQSCTVGSDDDDGVVVSPVAAAAAAAAASDAASDACGGASPTTASIPMTSSQPQIQNVFSCAQSSAALNVLLRASAGCDDGIAAAAAAAGARTPASPSSLSPYSASKQPCMPHWSHGSQRRRPSALAGAAAAAAAAAAGVGVGSVCVACGAPVPPDAPSAMAAAVAAAVAAAAPQLPSLVTYGSVSGSGASKLVAVARRFRGAATDRCSPNGSVSANGGMVGAGGGGAAASGSVGGGYLKPNSRLALTMSPRSERTLSQPSPRAPPPSFCLPQPPSPRFLGPAACSGGGGGAPVPYDILRATTRTMEDDLDSQMGFEGPPAGPGGAEAAAGGSGERPPAPILQEVERLLAGADGWHFDAWALRDASGGHALSALGFYLIQREGLMTRFHIKPVVLARLLRRLEAGYLDNPYHNAVHAADVLQTLHAVIHGAQLHVHYLDRLGLLAAYFAAIIHDYAHPGLTGDFLVATSHTLALRYNDRSPLENHHCAASFAVLKHSELDVTAGMSAAEKAGFRKTVIDLVMSTDMKQHFSILSHFNTVHRLAAYSQQQQQQQQQQQSQQSQSQHGPGQGQGQGQAGAHGGAQQGQQQQQQQGQGHHQPAPGEGTAGGGGGTGAEGGGGGGGGLAGSHSVSIQLVSNNGTGGAGASPAPRMSSALSPHALEEVVVLETKDGAASAAAVAPSTTGSVATTAAAATATAAAASTAPRPVDDTERLLSLQLALKCADIGNLGRELECYKRWVYGLEEEFFRQGDKERELGLPISPLSDRTKQGVSKSQTGFFDFVALPLVHAMAAAFPGAQPLLRAFLDNYNHWKRADAAAASVDSTTTTATTTATATATITAAGNTTTTTSALSPLTSKRISAARLSSASPGTAPPPAALSRGGSSREQRRRSSLDQQQQQQRQRHSVAGGAAGAGAGAGAAAGEVA
ncbi:hypothetical protein PLESTF_000618600 [Pleodorina starrii]|nr:hypothetical protein PLESTF_000618600 [Pleodorina starrii]